ncbi:hypothetical protein ABD81_10240 [Bacillus thuringiensis]|uniref:Uncharacterized protein n=1 Tax=Bacillus wiedmannii TaxID=1890302 RepID=A0A242YZ46_9BACI|nr:MULTISPECIES: hypothetical protein [Bacillus cereus group]MBG9753063.1 hypothetical protein [Bacillus thuringiensis]MBG9778123.1 hypothetical protein [Bacillus thuringiensis]OTX84977.1 hypothetical protein BK730_24730 [Bacillus wiedmannii]OTZ80828.1 hypothetical protein BK771_32355 [Bacillus thuringiensis serovar ostriniae]
MFEELKSKKEYHEVKKLKYERIHKLYFPFLWVVALVYFLYFMFIDNSISVYMVVSFGIGLILWGLGLYVIYKIAYHIRELEKIMDIEVLNTMEENEFLSPGRKERYIKDFSAAKDSLERITIYAKFMLEAKERKEELEDDSNTLGIR